MNQPEYGKLHYFGSHDSLRGWYWQLTDAHDQPVTDLVGPYDSADLAKQAAQWAFERGQF